MDNVFEFGDKTPGEFEAVMEADDVSEMESAIDNVAEAVCGLWEVTGGDVDASVVTMVDGQLVRITVSVDMV